MCWQFIYNNNIKVKHIDEKRWEKKTFSVILLGRSYNTTQKLTSAASVSWAIFENSHKNVCIKPCLNGFFSHSEIFWETSSNIWNIWENFVHLNIKFVHPFIYFTRFIQYSRAYILVWNYEELQTNSVFSRCSQIVNHNLI